jgi:iron complex outermembrane receptor protein
MKIRHPIPFKNSETELFTHFVNLLDEDHESHFGYPDDGFRVTAGANIEF